MQHALALAWHTIRTTIDAFFLNLPNIVVALIIFLTFLAGARYAQSVIIRLAQRAGLDSTLSTVLGSLTRFCVSIGGFLVAAVVVLPGFSPASLIAGLGVTSVAIGFAFQDILKNFFAGLLLLWQKPFRIGDEIKTGDYEGTVEEINIRATILRMYSGESVVLPNGKIYSDPIIVLTANNKRRLHLTIKLDSSTELDRARAVVLQVLDSSAGVFSEPAPQVFLGAQDGSNAALDIYFWSAPQHESILTVQDRVSSEIRRNLFASVASESPANAVPQPLSAPLAAPGNNSGGSDNLALESTNSSRFAANTPRAFSSKIK